MLFHATQNDGTVQAIRTLSQIATLRLLKSSPRNDWAHSSLVDDYPSITTSQLATLNCKDCTLSFALHPGGLHVWNRPTRKFGLRSSDDLFHKRTSLAGYDSIRKLLLIFRHVLKCTA